MLNLARLRKFDHLLIENFNTMPIYIELEDVETDYLYNKGKLEGELKGKLEGKLEGEDSGAKLALQIIKYHKKGLDVKAIAQVLGIEESKVEQVIKEAKAMDLL